MAAYDLIKLPGEDALHEAFAVFESHEHDVFLRSEVVNTTENSDTGSFRVCCAQLDLDRVDDVQFDPHGLR